MIYLMSTLFLLVGLTIGWVASEKYIAYMQKEAHDFDHLFKNNPHPEIFDEDGAIDKGEYISIRFDADFDPELWDPENDIIEE